MNVQELRKKIIHAKGRQLGSERNTTPLPPLHEKPSTFKLTMNRLAITLTVLFWVAYILSIVLRQFIEGPQSYDFTMEAILYTIVVTFLNFSALMYLIARQGAYDRFSRHVRVPHAVLEKHFSTSATSITVLIPSYDEEPDVVRKTIFSAALQEFPNKRIVLLIDDNPFPIEKEKLDRLNETKEVAKEIENLLSLPFGRFNNALKEFINRNKETNKPVDSKEIILLAEHYTWAVNYLEELAQKESVKDHVDLFFVEQVILGLANDLRTLGEALRLSLKDKAEISKERIVLLYKRLNWIFKVEISNFERKRYASLSQESNKAMNLNSYIGLMGGSYQIDQTPDGPILVPLTNSKKTANTLHVPDSDFLLTLDADSILLRDYCLRLVYFLQQPGNEKVAVTQTPYSSFRGAFSRIERLSGATTDVQHILHQGLTRYGATFWVGANAVIRKNALDSIVEKEWVGGFEIKRYIQDRTVIEDTESSIDLGIHGWTLMNYPERLSYSATPPDFGSLVIQRRRWANGGLLILPKLWKQIQERKRRNEIIPVTEILLRVNYMASITWASFGLIFLLAYPFSGQLLSPLVLLTALPYFIAQANDLKYCGYKYSDIFSIYGFNLILLPVNLAGVLKSIEQALTNKKIPFARTPKIKNRTASGVTYVLFPTAIIIFSIYICVLNLQELKWGNAIFAGFNALTATWATLAYIGIGNIISDLWHSYINWLYIDVTPRKKASKSKENQKLDWKAVLYHGDGHGYTPHSSVDDIKVSQINTDKDITNV